MIDGGTEATKDRPVVVVSRDDLNHGDYVLVVPFYSQQLEKRKNQRFCAFFQTGEGGLRKDCVAKGDEVTMIDKAEIDFARGSLGRLMASQLARVINAIRFAIRDDSLGA